jgi:hypothetical protein
MSWAIARLGLAGGPDGAADGGVRAGAFLAAYHSRMRWMRGAILLVTISGLISVPAAASPLVLAPPGHAGANQYFETIPTSSGNAAPPGSVRGSGNATASPAALSALGQGRRGDQRLARLGKNGQAAAVMAASTAPTPVAGAPGASTSPVTHGPGPAGSIASGISHVLTGSDAGGLGVALPLLLATALIAALGVLAARLWRRTPSQPGA